MQTDTSLVQALQEKGVIIHDPGSTILFDLDPSRVEAGVEIYPATTVCGPATLLRAGTRLGRAGGGWFESVRAGRGVDLFSGYFQDCVFLDGVTLRGHAEVRGGTLLEEGCEGAHHVGYKMTVMLPYVVAGSLVNFCDALFAGGTSRKDHSEIGSTLALYNYTPWGDKFASQFGDVPSGVFLRSPRIFVGGQTQIVSPIKVGFGTVIAAGSPRRRSVGTDRLVASEPVSFDLAFDGTMLGGLMPKFDLTAEYIGNLLALELWYERVRIPTAKDSMDEALYRAAITQIDAGVAERLKRLGRIIDRVPASRDAHVAALEDAGPEQAETHRRRIAEHDDLVEIWPGWRGRIERAASQYPSALEAPLDSIAAQLRTLRAEQPNLTYIQFMTEHLDESLIEPARNALQVVVDSCAREHATSADRE